MAVPKIPKKKLISQLKLTLSVSFAAGFYSLDQTMARRSKLTYVKERSFYREDCLGVK